MRLEGGAQVQACRDCPVREAAVASRAPPRLPGRRSGASTRFTRRTLGRARLRVSFGQKLADLLSDASHVVESGHVAGAVDEAQPAAGERVRDALPTLGRADVSSEVPCTCSVGCRTAASSPSSKVRPGG